MLVIIARSRTSTISSLLPPITTATGFSSPRPSLRHSTRAIVEIRSSDIGADSNVSDSDSDADAGAGYSDFSTHTFKISKVAITAEDIHSSDTHSRTEWKFWPPAQTFGVSRPI